MIVPARAEKMRNPLYTTFAGSFVGEDRDLAQKFLEPVSIRSLV